MYLSDETKKILSKQIGIPYEQLIKMDDDEMQQYVEQKTGKKIGWKEGIKIKGVSIISIEEEAKKREKKLQKTQDYER